MGVFGSVFRCFMRLSVFLAIFRVVVVRGPQGQVVSEKLKTFRLFIELLLKRDSPA